MTEGSRFDRWESSFENWSIETGKKMMKVGAGVVGVGATIEFLLPDEGMPVGLLGLGIVANGAVMYGMPKTRQAIEAGCNRAQNYLHQRPNRPDDQ